MERMLKLVLDKYEMRDSMHRETVGSYILRQGKLVSKVVEFIDGIPEIIKRYFGEEIKITLEVEWDKEESRDKLVVIILDINRDEEEREEIYRAMMVENFDNIDLIQKRIVSIEMR